MSKHIARSEHRLELAKQQHELSECRRYLVFRRYTNVDAVRLHGLRSCRIHLLCAACAIARGSRLMLSYIPKYEELRRQNPGIVAQMITVTVKDGEDLDERFEHLVRSLRQLMKRRFLGRGSEAERILGAVYSVEVKRGKNSGDWHPHVHIFSLSAADAKVRALQLSDEWREITGDSYILDVHDVYGDHVEAFGEVFKYAVKFSDLPGADSVDAYRSLRRRRLIGTYGLFHGVDVPDELADDLLEDQAQPYIDLMFTYFGPTLGYLHSGVVGRSEESAA